jgi:hypothetical protein
LSALEARLGASYLDQVAAIEAGAFVKIYNECAAQGLPDFEDVIEDQAAVLRAEMNRVPCGVVAAMAPAAKKQGLDADCRWTVAAAVALAHRMFNGADMLESMVNALGEYSRVHGPKKKSKKAATV